MNAIGVGAGSDTPTPDAVCGVMVASGTSPGRGTAEPAGITSSFLIRRVTMAIEVRRAVPGDVPSLEIIRRQAIEATYSAHYPREAYADLVATPDPDLPTWIESDRYVVVVGETPVTPASFAACDRRDGELLAMCTAPDYEGRGYASRLLCELIDSLSETDVEFLSVWAPDPVRPFFRENGFEPIDGRTDSPVPGQRMRRALSPDD